MAKVVQTYKPKQSLLNMEDVDIHTLYAFTVNPCDKYQHFTSFTRLNDCFKELDNVLLLVRNYEVYPELSKQGRIHYHGYIWFNSTEEIISFYLHINNTLRKCTIEIDTLDGTDKWERYITKQIRFHEYFVVQTFQMVPIVRGTKERILSRA